jgi:subtilase family serine protease
MRLDGEGTFSGAASLMQLRQALFDAQANHVTVLASSGDGGTSNRLKQPVKNPQLIPYPSVGWSASDPLVTAVGGTYLCSFQNTLPAGSSYVGSSVGAPGANSNMRGVPDVALQASARTGTLVYMTEPATTTSGTGCGGANPMQYWLVRCAWHQLQSAPVGRFDRIADQIG